MDPNILSIILYGSQARNDQDNLSDIDVCIFTREVQAEGDILQAVQTIFNESQRSKLSVTCYSNSSVDLMLEYGSLFMWHLKLEGKVLYGENFFNNKISQLREFKNHKEEIDYHYEIFNDLKNAWEQLEIVNELDLAVLFTICRNSCMILAHYTGSPAFGRISCFEKAHELYPCLPIKLEEYLFLSRWKLIYERGMIDSINLPASRHYAHILANIGKLLLYVKSTVTKQN